MTIWKIFVDFIGDQYGSSSETLAPDDDPLDNCSYSSHGICPLLSFFYYLYSCLHTRHRDSCCWNYCWQEWPVSESLSYLVYWRNTAFSKLTWPRFVGVAPGAKLLSFKVFGDTGYSNEEIVIEAFLKAFDSGVSRSTNFHGAPWSKTNTSDRN